MTLIDIAFRYIPIGVEFGHKGQMYTKTNFNKGYFWKNGIKVHRVFRKRTLITTDSNYFEI